MSNCCSPAGQDGGRRNKHKCPANGRSYPEVSLRTIAHHIKAPWAWQAAAARYFFCDDPDCEVAYFGDDGSTVLESQLRTSLGVKDDSGHRLVCYCFGISKAEAEQNPATRDYVVAQTKAGLCSCEVSNPSGRCCLKDFPKAV